MASEEFTKAQQLIKSGEKEAGKNMLIRMVKDDPYNEDAWMLLASLNTAEQRIYCLQKVLAINPKNEKARAQLDKLRPQQALHEWSLEREPKRAVERQPQPQPMRESYAGTADIEEPYQRPDGSLLFKPGWDKVLLTYTLPYTVLTVALLLYLTFVEGDPSDVNFFLTMLLIMLSVVAVGTLIRMSPLYHVKMSDTNIRGPRSIRYAWARNQLSIRSIDTGKTQLKFGFMGYYVIRNSKNSGIYLTGFRKQTMLDMLEIIKKRQGDLINHEKHETHE